ncbi:hypothetical protein PUNSTDRAFT_75682 [Punctularia strigosozonata HHB-11173 SS5]|uniref:Oxidoreductase AflY n=1 Tax=Punctularia strigosozonata (strain HHB-11173) TaxID=741275 RepID=R7S3V0_PUNST|nr:uncharacterized protein PUNSTDRAFT_75682 [Punctularia strigosozonata HHB-11173 SS5]EIN04883.1 hypothetical protein PUNSTDRAFT_75682 [Punctularia strigosozonata HHB-11173 SS5]
MDLSDLFPSVIPPPQSHLLPQRWPGVDQSSTATLIEALKDNHERWHLFFNDRGFHNHTAHRLLALWTLGGSAPLLETAYEKDKKTQRKVIASPSEITTENFTKHLGDEVYYRAYLDFFVDAIKRDGVAATLKTYLFSYRYNFGDGTLGSRPYMLDRFVAGVIHPLIHVGYGVEFGIPGILAEGLAQTCAHPALSTVLMVEHLFPQEDHKDHSELASATSLLSSVIISSSTMPENPPSVPASGPHALTILARVLKDDLFSPRRPHNTEQSFTAVLEDRERVEKIIQYADEWLSGTPGNVEQKFEELAWMNVVIYGVGGFTKSKTFNADFFTMHLVTTSLFVPSLARAVKLSSQLALLHVYFATSLAHYVGRGRPAIDIGNFYDNTSRGVLPLELREPVSLEKYGARGVKIVSNPWLPLIQSALWHPDDHIPKVQRTLAHYARLYGHRHSGHFSGLLADADDKLPSLEKLDSTLFLRVAGLTMSRLGWMREGQPAGAWDRHGFFDA